MIIDITEKVNQLGEDTMWQDSLKTIFYELSEGGSFDRALGRAYPSSVETMTALEQGWVKYFEEQ